MDRTKSIYKIPVTAREKSLKRLRSVFSEMIRTGMFAKLLLEELKLCRTQAEKEVVCSALCRAKARMRHLRKRLKRHLASEPFRTPGTASALTEGKVDLTYAAVLLAST
jgi:hypothetical protein